MSIIENVEAGDYKPLPADEKLPPEVGAGTDIARVTYEIENPKSSKDSATLRERRGEIVVRSGLGSLVTEDSFIFPERSPDGTWRVSEIELPKQ